MSFKEKNLPVSFFPLAKDNNVSIGSWITIPHPSVAEIMAKAGFNWLVVDMEHSPIGIFEAEQMIRTIHLHGLPALVRVGECNANLIKRVMDCGASGVITPMINTPQAAKQVVAAVKYPPKGIRGVGLARAQGYGMLFEEYRKWVAEKSRVIVQIEHIEAVKNLEAILSVEGVDGFIVGPYDLSGSLGIPGEFGHPEMLKALREIKTVIDKRIKPCGFHVVEPDVGMACAKLQEGYSFLAFGADFLFLGKTSKSKLQNLRGKIGKG